MVRTPLAPSLLCVLLVAASPASVRGAADRVEADDAAALIAAWNAIPQQELQQVWEEAQLTAGAIAVEPETHGVGAQAGQKKTWDFADRILQLFWGSSPNWFPADLVRRTTCGPDPRWSYFWHELAGEERDLHPWISRAHGFTDLLGPAHASALVASGALDLSNCSEVQGADEACLYGEVTPPAGFENWFCGERKRPCRARLKADPTNVPRAFANPARLCFAGPWVMERVHAWRPEIHPAELVWVRSDANRPVWRFALIPDDSQRFDEPQHFAALERATVRPWSRDRPVELWIAFRSEAAQPIVFDLAVRALRKDPEPTRMAVLTPPADPARFATVPHALGDAIMAFRSWQDPSCDCTRGFLVVRTRYSKKDRKALLLGVTGRRPDEPPTSSPFEAPPTPERAAVLPAVPAVHPSVRLLAFARVEPRPGPGTFVVNALAGFDPRRASEPEDERLAERKTKALTEDEDERQREFGTARPFRLAWTLEASRPPANTPVPIVVPGRGRIAEGTDSAEVIVRAFRGKVAVEVTLNEAGLPPVERAGADVVSVGELLVTVPHGVVLEGKGRIDYVGPAALELPRPAAIVSFRVPIRTYASEWELVREVLAEVDSATAAERARNLDADACAPLPAGCTIDALGAEVASRIATPITRWGALRELQAPQRSLARFVRLFARALIWDGRAADDERERLKRLLAAVYAPPTP